MTDRLLRVSPLDGPGLEDRDMDHADVDHQDVLHDQLHCASAEVAGSSHSQQLHDDDVEILGSERNVVEDLAPININLMVNCEWFIAIWPIKIDLLATRL